MNNKMIKLNIEKKYFGEIIMKNKKSVVSSCTPPLKTGDIFMIEEFDGCQPTGISVRCIATDVLDLGVMNDRLKGALVVSIAVEDKVMNEKLYYLSIEACKFFDEELRHKIMPLSNWTKIGISQTALEKRYFEHEKG